MSDTRNKMLTATLPQLVKGSDSLRILYSPGEAMVEAPSRPHYRISSLIGRGTHRLDPDFFPNATQRRIFGYHDVRRAIDDFRISDRWKREARINARRIESLLMAGDDRRISRHEASGRFDRRKAKLVAMYARAGRNIDDLHPYTRIRRDAPTKPKLVLVVGISASSMWRDRTFIPSVAQSALAAQWAAAAADVDCVTLVTQMVDDDRHIHAIEVANTERRQSLRVWSWLMNRDIKRHRICGVRGDTAADSALWGRFISKNIPSHPSIRSFDSMSDSGGYGVLAARTLHPDAQIIIGIGQLLDGGDADAYYPARKFSTYKEHLMNDIAKALLALSERAVR